MVCHGRPGVTVVARASRTATFALLPRLTTRLFAALASINILWLRVLVPLSGQLRSMTQLH